MKRVKIFTVISVLTLLLGMQVTAAEEDNPEQQSSNIGTLDVGNVRIVEDGELTGKMPPNVNYDIETNILTLNNYYLKNESDEIYEIYGIRSWYMGDNFTIRVKGENTLNVYQSSPYSSLISINEGNLTIEGPGTLNLSDVSSTGIKYEGDLTIKNCTLNISGNTEEYGMFYGFSGLIDDERETIITNSQINIHNTMTSKSQAANAGIDVQAGNLTVQNSEVDIELKNGNIFGLAAGQSEEYGGRLTVKDSSIKCNTSTDLGNRYNHNMYFYKMTNADNLYYYVSDGDSFIQKEFNEAFKLGKYLSKRYDTNYGYTWISSTFYAEYCSHKWNTNITKKPTCTASGLQNKICSRCGKKIENETVPATGHTYKQKVEKKATTTKNGIITKYCTKCGIKQSSTAIPAVKSVSLSTTTYTYNGKIKKPSVTVKGNNGKTISTSNYSVSYSSGRKNVGKYTVKVTFKGNYTGTVSKTFKINPKKTSVSSIKAGKKKMTVKWKKQTKQVTGYQIQYSTDKKFKKSVKTSTVTKYKTNSKTIKRLKAKKKYYVRIRTYKKVGSTKYYSGWSSVKSVKVK